LTPPAWFLDVGSISQQYGRHCGWHEQQVVRRMIRALVFGWAVFIGYYVLRVTVWAFPDSCPDTVWETSEDRRCDWTLADIAWLVSLPALALATLIVVGILLARQIRIRRRRP